MMLNTAATMPTVLWQDSFASNNQSSFTSNSDQSFFSSDKGPSSGGSTPPVTTPTRMKWADIQDLEEDCSTEEDLPDFLTGSWTNLGNSTLGKDGALTDPFAFKPVENAYHPGPADLFEAPAKPKGKVKLQNKKLYVDRAETERPPQTPPTPPLAGAAGSGRDPATFRGEYAAAPTSWQVAQTPSVTKNAPQQYSQQWPVQQAPHVQRGGRIGHLAATKAQEESMAAKHKAGSCKQCLFYFSAVGCNKGDACTFCHISHTHCGSARPSKAKRERYRRLFSAIATSMTEDQPVGMPCGPLPR